MPTPSQPAHSWSPDNLREVAATGILPNVNLRYHVLHMVCGPQTHSREPSLVHHPSPAYRGAYNIQRYIDLSSQPPANQSTGATTNICVCTCKLARNVMHKDCRQSAACSANSAKYHAAIFAQRTCAAPFPVKFRELKANHETRKRILFLHPWSP